MILHENHLPADDSHEISCLICYFGKSGKIFNSRLLEIIGGALRVKYCALKHRLILKSMFKVKNAFFLHYKTSETV